MAKSARAAIEDLLTCESCHAFYYVERGEDTGRTRLRCTSCGHARDVLMSGARTGKWTVIDPNGEVSSFGAWEELVRSKSTSGITAVGPASSSDPVAAAPETSPYPVATMDDAAPASG
jgi:hypothetical protein